MSFPVIGRRGAIQRLGGALAVAPAILRGRFALFAQSPAEELIEAGHWKRARAMVEARMREAPNDPLAIYLMSQIRRRQYAAQAS